MCSQVVLMTFCCRSSRCCSCSWLSGRRRCVKTGLFGYLLETIWFQATTWVFLHLLTNPHPFEFILDKMTIPLPSLHLSNKNSTQTCTKAMSSKNPWVCVPTLVCVRIYVCRCVPESVSASIAGAYPRFPWWPHNRTRQSEASPRSAARGH